MAACENCSALDSHNQMLHSTYKSTTKSQRCGEFGSQLVDRSNRTVQIYKQLCQETRDILGQVIPNLKRNETVKDNSQYNTLIFGYEKLMENLNACHKIHNLESEILKLKAEREIRAWIDYARSLIIENLKPKYFSKSEFVFWKDIVDYGKFNDKSIWADVNVVVYQLLKLNSDQWETLSRVFYGKQSNSLHTICESAENAKRLLEELSWDPFNFPPEKAESIKQLLRYLIDTVEPHRKKQLNQSKK
jgi:hypothetical protein